jgi:hypothetical protein
MTTAEVSKDETSQAAPWSVFGRVETTEHIDGFGTPKRIDAQVRDEMREQIAAAKEAAQALIASGAVGEGPHDVALSGSVNPGHAGHADGYESITITITKAV